MPTKTLKPLPKGETNAKKSHVVLNLLLVLAFLGAAAVGVRGMKRYVESRLTYTKVPPRVILKDQPAWMSDFLAGQICLAAQPSTTGSIYDRQLLQDVAAGLKLNPWVRQVKQVRRVYGNAPGDTLEIDCDFRTPIALVHAGEFFWLVDTEGVKLPQQFSAQQVPKVVIGRDGRMNIRIIDGVKNAAPSAGKIWPGDDLAAGISLAKLLSNQVFAEEVVKIDVRNFAGRLDPREAELVLITQYKTQVRWGRSADAKDAFVEVSANQKLDVLRRVFQQYGRIDANQPWIDIRFDRVTYPGPASPAQADTR